MVTTQKSSIGILLIDQHAMIRVALAAGLEVYDELVLLGEAEDGETGLHCAARLQPDVVITEIFLPQMSGIELTKQLTENHPDMKVIVLSTSINQADIDAVLAAGARKYLSKNSISVDELVQAIHEVVEPSAAFHGRIDGQ